MTVVECYRGFSSVPSLKLGPHLVLLVHTFTSFRFPLHVISFLLFSVPFSERRWYFSDTRKYIYSIKHSRFSGPV